MDINVAGEFQSVLALLCFESSHSPNYSLRWPISAPGQPSDAWLWTHRCASYTKATGSCRPPMSSPSQAHLFCWMNLVFRLTGGCLLGSSNSAFWIFISSAPLTPVWDSSYYQSLFQNIHKDSLLPCLNPAWYILFSTYISFSYFLGSIPFCSLCLSPEILPLIICDRRNLTHPLKIHLQYQHFLEVLLVILITIVSLNSCTFVLFMVLLSHFYSKSFYSS